MNGIKLMIFQLNKCIFKKVNCKWKYSQMQRSQGTSDIKTWKLMKRLTLELHVNTKLSIT